MSNMGKGVGHRRRPDVEPRGHSTKSDLVAANFDFKRLCKNFLSGVAELAEYERASPLPGWPKNRYLVQIPLKWLPRIRIRDIIKNHSGRPPGCPAAALPGCS